MEDLITKAKNKLEELQAKSAAKGEIKAFITLVLSVLKTTKDNFDGISNENKLIIKQAIEYIDTEHSKLKENVSQETEKAKKQFTDLINEAKLFLEDVKMIEVFDGEDGKDGVDGKDGKDGKDGSPDTREQIVEKINTGKDKDTKIEAKQISGLPEFTREVVREVGGTIETPLKAGTNITITKDASGANVITSTGGTGGGHTIQDNGTPLTQRTNLNFIGATIADDAVNDATKVTITGGSMTYPGAGIPLSTGSAWGTSITNNSTNWNTAYGWGNHAGLYLPLHGTADAVSGLTITAGASISGSNTGDQTLSSLGAQAQLNGTGFVKASGTSISYDNSTYLTAVTAHNLLSGTHGDTTADTVVRGDIITGQGATPKWARLAFPGTPTGKVIIASATDVGWSTSPLGTAAYAATGDFATSTQGGKADTALQSLSGAVLTTTNQSVAGIKTFSDATEASNATTGGTIVSGGLAVAKRVYATDMTVTNKITGSISGNCDGNAGTVTNGIYTTSQVTTLAASGSGDKDKYVHTNASTGALEYVTLAGGGDMLLGTVQSVTAEKKFTNDKITLLGSSTGKNILHAENSSATDYTTTIPAKTATLATTVQTEFISGLIDTVVDQDYKIIQNIPYAITITKVTTICVSGTATLTGKIGTTALGGTANSVSNSEDVQTHSSDNAMSIGDDLKITMSSNSACLRMAFTIEFTKTLA